MYPTLPSQLTYIIISRRHKHGRNVRIGDLVVFRSPIFPAGQSCKRVIGMPGDYVVTDPDLSHTVGGAEIAGQEELREGLGREEPRMVQVPEGHVWVAGDNLSYSRDSRFHGPVPMGLIQGKTLYVGTGWFSWASFRGKQLGPAVVNMEMTQRGEDAREDG
jgi:mitochondrial inner membrane protease subunit 1